MGAFPCSLVASIQCRQCGGALAIAVGAELTANELGVRRGRLCCTSCGDSTNVSAGIVLSGAGEGDLALHDESRHEQQLRDARARSTTGDADDPRWNSEYQLMEILSALAALDIHPGDAILELGCGDGRYTTRLAPRCASLLAIDLSLESLAVLDRRLRGAGNVGLVHADVTTLRVPSRRFDVVYSTLTSNLPTREHRQAMYRVAADALRSDGRFVFSAHHQGIMQWLSGESKSGRYAQGHIYRYNFALRECVNEVRPYFASVRAWPIQIRVPFPKRIGLPTVELSRRLERVPVVNRLGDLILCVAQAPLAAG